MAFVLHVLRRGDLFVDIGVKVGAYTILACAAAGASGISFEPVPKTFRRLMDNVQMNALEPRVRCFNAGLAASAGRVIFTEGRGARNHVLADGGKTSETTTVETTTVETTTLDDALGGEVPFMIKIDVEGYETPVLRGGKQTFADPRLHAVIMELNESVLRYGFKDRDLLATKRDYGFVACRYDPFRCRLEAHAHGENDGGNVIFVRDLEVISNRGSSAPSVTVLGRTI